MAESSRGRLCPLLFTSSFSSQEELSLSCSTSRHPWLSKTTKTWDRAPSLAHLYPLYKSAQITQQPELDVGCYSPEARTSINPCVRPFARPSEAQHAIRYKFAVSGRQPRQVGASCVSWQFFRSRTVNYDNNGTSDDAWGENYSDE
jgi:hypothetical protein